MSRASMNVTSNVCSGSPLIPVDHVLYLVALALAGHLRRVTERGHGHYPVFIGDAQHLADPVLVVKPHEYRAEPHLGGFQHDVVHQLSLIHISEPTRLGMISYAVFCLKKK